MERIEAVRSAKQYVRELFADERIAHIRLEELDFDRETDEWRITIGFAYECSGNELLPSLTKRMYGDRVYKVVRISAEDGDFVAISDRFLDPPC